MFIKKFTLLKYFYYFKNIWNIKYIVCLKH